jgi:phage shock protein PspC (stress-responsive transcriptional regulator)
MMLKSLSGLCSALHAIAWVCGALSVYFFFGPAIERVMVALIMLGAAVVFEVIAAIANEHSVAHC